MSFSIYTSCALNYLPKARALAASLAERMPDARITLCLCDEAPSWLDLSAEPFDRIWFPRDLGYDRAWIFDHNTMELCTAVKGRALRQLIDEEPADLHAFLDPDVYLFNSLQPVEDMMSGASIGVVPHITAPEETDIGVEMTEMSVTSHGIYNLGHLFVRPDQNGIAFAEWWAQRLDRHCFDDRFRGLFTDQRWVDLAPAIFDGVRVLRNPGLNVASWNLSSRRIELLQPGDHRSFRVNGEPLLTYHFSGTGPTGTHRQVREIFDPTNGATAELERIYEQALADHGQARLMAHPPAHEHYDNGEPILPGARRLYRDHGDLRRAFPDPFVVGEESASYYSWLQEHRPALATGVRLAPDRLDAAYRELFDEAYYLSRYPEVAAKIERGTFSSALEHYERVGSALLFDPNNYFVSAYYLARLEEMNCGWTDPRGPARERTLLWHYVSAGLAMGLEPVEFFDSGWYLRSNPDLEAAFRTHRLSSPLGHFLKYGSAEGRDPGPDFVGHDYLERSPDARSLVQQEAVSGAFGALVHLGGVTGRLGKIEG